MTNPLDHPALLRLIGERSTAFRDAVTAAPGLGTQVPTCPAWTLFDLVRHVGEVQRRWAATVTAGPADGPTQGVAEDAPELPREKEALLAWSAESTRALLDALRAAGPDRECWTWWGGSQTPQTSGGVARHQLQEVAVHTYDAQATGDGGRPLPEEVALDGVEEFLETCCAGPYSWPYEPGAVDYATVEGPAWRLTLTGDGVHSAPVPTPSDEAAATLTGTASDLVLALYARIPVDLLKIDGNRRVFDELLAWDPE
ncbi:maleylpyruvate isomerase family mycothiol-dependent enzyme [Actinoplanes utahensis]|uniref:Mycothiol-dependent maleylpyruvate isomerase metal-binding domain-containing protein n=1 Tax=Actinoplanes utahensis TaxID=1869 RepID=A0A0A6UDX1_ACTUT|nr:maleylpyruvate isomerase family mycothiol-dependent enzyme [Actinoplanes utahensis]KHD74230.1 hypothetical protein MB27_29810 [Actinoplanes utahensis]GIF35452.1 hypothetical protein Aut01nite_84380 [Actinoplanes utahensis]